jgi:hypothetical protein
MKTSIFVSTLIAAGLCVAGQASAHSFGHGPLAVAPVPEPSTWAMMIVGFAGLGLAIRSRRRKALAA